jgi:hypothetical protein
MMKKQTILYLILIVLFLSNAFFIYHHLGRHGNKEHRTRFSMAEELKFNESQQKAYDSIRTLHFDKMRLYSRKITELKEQLYKDNSDGGVTDMQLDSITSLIANEEKNKDLEMYAHFKSVRNICDAQQKEKLTTIIKDAINRRGRRGRFKKKEK